MTSAPEEDAEADPIGVATKPIIVGIDGSDGSRDAARWAARYAVRAGVALRLVHAVVVPDWLGSIISAPMSRHDTLGHEMRVRGGHLLTAAANAATEAASSVNVETRLIQGHITEVLEMESSNALILVIGARSVAPGRDLGLGLDTSAMTTRARCPLIVHNNQSSDGADQVGTVIVGVGTSDDSASAVLDAMELADTMSAEVVVTHTDHVSIHETIEFNSGLLDWDRFHAARERSLEERLHLVFQQFPRVHVTIVCRSDEPAQALMALAQPGDLIVVGTHERHRLAAAFRRPVYEDLIRHAPCSVMVVHSSVTSDI